MAHLPCHEANSLHDRGLDDFFAGEYTPCHSIWAVGMSVGLQVTLIVDYIVGDVAIAFDVLQEEGK
jgi:hypothetical protein